MTTRTQDSSYGRKTSGLGFNELLRCVSAAADFAGVPQEERWRITARSALQRNDKGLSGLVVSRIALARKVAVWLVAEVGGPGFHRIAYRLGMTGGTVSAAIWEMHTAMARDPMTRAALLDLKDRAIGAATFPARRAAA